MRAVAHGVLVTSCVLAIAWSGCIFNPQPEPPAATETTLPDDGSAGAGAFDAGQGGTSAAGGRNGVGGEAPGGLWGDQSGIDRQRYPIGGDGAGGSESTGGAGGGA